MKFKTLMIIKAMASILVAILILGVPKFFYGLLGLTLDAAEIYPAWGYGACLVGNALLTWHGRYAKESKGRRAIIKGMTAYNTIGFILTVIASLNGMLNVLGWGAAAIYLFFAIGFGYFWLKPPTP